MHSISGAGFGRHLLSSFAAVVMALSTLGLIACNNGGNGDPPVVDQLQPDFEIAADTLDFEDIRVGTYWFRGITVGNYGRANLELKSFQINDDVRGAFQVELDKSFIQPGGTGTIKVTYTPPDEGPDTGTLVFETNDPDVETFSISLLGNGTIPQLLLDPAGPLTFNDVAVGDSEYQDVLLSNNGTGRLSIKDISIPEAYADHFSVTLPPSFESGKEIPAGDLLGIRVTYTPTEDTGEGVDNGLLVVESDDPRRPRVETELLGSTQAAPIDLPPVVEILTPDPYETEITTRYVGRPVVFEAVVSDDNDSPEDLSATWYSDIDGKLETSSPDTEGNVSLVTSGLSVGEHIVRVFVYDSGGQTGRAEVKVKVWNEDSDFDYIIAGHNPDPGGLQSAYRYFRVDDNIEIYRIDGVTGDTVPCLIVFDDILNNLSPVICNAHIGDTIRIIVYDRYAERGEVDGLNLFFGDEHQRLIEPYVVDTGKGGEKCPDSPYKGGPDGWYTTHTEPYTGDCVILHEEIEVTIPLTPDE